MWLANCYFAHPSASFRIVLKPSTPLGLHKALSKQNYRVLFSLWLANCCFANLARPKMPSRANAFEISDTQEEETEV